MFKNKAPISAKLANLPDPAPAPIAPAKPAASSPVAASLLRQAPRTTHSDQNARPNLNVDPDGTSMWLKVIDVDLYERNPRTQRNPLWDEIRQSMIDRVAESKATGQPISPISHPVKVTQRHPGGRYVLAAGGNTRVAIQKELYLETGDPHYLQSLFIFVPYRGESAILADHWLENELRSSTCFWDKACFFVTMRSEICAERGVNDIALRVLEDALSAKSIRISKTLLNQYLWTAENLGGLGQARYELSQHSIRRLMPLYNRYDEVARMVGWEADQRARLLASVLADIDRRFAETAEFTLELVDQAFDHIGQQLLNVSLVSVERCIAHKAREGVTEEQLIAVLRGETIYVATAGAQTDAKEDPAASLDKNGDDEQAVGSAPKTAKSSSKQTGKTILRGAARDLLRAAGLPAEAVIDAPDVEGLVLNPQVVSGHLDSDRRETVWSLLSLASGERTDLAPDHALMSWNWITNPDEQLGQHVLSLLAALRAGTQA